MLTLIRPDAATNSGLHAQVGSAGARLSSSAGRLGVARSAWGDRHYICGGNGRRGSGGAKSCPTRGSAGWLLAPASSTVAAGRHFKTERRRAQFLAGVRVDSR